MKCCSVIAAATALGISFWGLSSPSGKAQQPAGNASIGAGAANAAAVKPAPAFLLADFTVSLNGKKLKAGDRVRGEVAQAVVGQGKIIIPAGAKLVGHVTEVEPRGANATSRLGIIFDKILLKHHQERNLQGVVYALAAPAPRRSTVDEPDPMLPPSYGPDGGMAPAPMGGGMTRMGGGMGHSMPMGTSAAPPAVPSAGMPDASTPVAITSAEPNSPLARGDNSPRRGTASPVSLGLRPGVYSIKGVSLALKGSAVTPGPVILSAAKNVKLDYGTQVVIEVVDGRALLP